jgi:hypothetical protein
MEANLAAIQKQKNRTHGHLDPSTRDPARVQFSHGPMQQFHHV